MKEFWSYDLNDILKQLNTGEDGLSSREAEGRIDKYGQNILEERKSSSNIEMLINQFKNPIIIILIFAAVLSIFLKDYSDGIQPAFRPDLVAHHGQKTQRHGRKVGQ